MANKHLKSLRILFVAGNKNSTKFLSDPAFIYRCQNPALALAEQGHQVDCIHYKELSRQKNPTDLIIFHRPCFRDWQACWFLKFELKRFRRQGTLLIADFDDLVFDPSYAAYSPGVVNSHVTLAQTQKTFAQHAKTLQHFNLVTVSTQPLKQFAQKLFESDRVIWLPNSPHFTWRDKSVRTNQDECFSIKYLPGTRSHDRDFALIAEPIADFLHQHPDTKLKITGVLDYERLSPSIKALANQVEWQDKQPYQDYWRVVNDANVHIAPLEDNTFNRCKSALKAIEANYFDRPLVASPIPDMERLDKPGVDLAKTPEEWFEKLKQHYQSATQEVSLRQKILSQYSVQQHAQELIASYERFAN